MSRKPKKATDGEGLEGKLNSLAETMADKLIGGEAPTKGEIEAFKILANFYIGSRSKGLTPDDENDDDDGGFSFAKTKNQLLRGQTK